MGGRGQWWEFRDVVVRSLLIGVDVAKCGGARQGQRIGARKHGSDHQV